MPHLAPTADSRTKIGPTEYLYRQQSIWAVANAPSWGSESAVRLCMHSPSIVAVRVNSPSVAAAVNWLPDGLNGLWAKLEDDVVEAHVLAGHIQISNYVSVQGLGQLYAAGRNTSVERWVSTRVAQVTSAELTGQAARYAVDAGLMAIVEEVGQIVTRLFTQQRPRVFLTPVCEEGDIPLLCFEIRATGTTEQVLDQDEALQGELFDRIQPDDRAAFSFLYRRC